MEPFGSLARELSAKLTEGLSKNKFLIISLSFAFIPSVSSFLLATSPCNKGRLIWFLQTLKISHLKSNIYNLKSNLGKPCIVSSDFKVFLSKI